MGMLTIRRYGQSLCFDDTGFTATRYVYRPLATGKLYEEPFLEYVRSLGRVGEYVDVGAHLGTHSVWFAAMCPATHVHAFEPVARYAEVARRNLIANGAGDKSSVHQIGLAARRGRATNYMSAEHQIGFGEAGAAGVTEGFDVDRMDDIVTGPVAVIKLDVEGMEVEVLRGATRILEHHQPVIFAESLSVATARRIARELAPFGYRPTWRIFNASPTYKFSTEAPRGWARARVAQAALALGLRAGRRVAAKARRALRAAYPGGTARA
jgi:FkbM family methyltransferase